MRDLLNLLKQQSGLEEFDALRIGLASPEMIKSWSFGEVKKPETINYRTFKPGARRSVLCPHIRARQGLRMPLRQVQATQAPRRHLREVRRRSHAGQGAPRAHGPRGPREPGSPYLVPEILPSRIGLLLDMTLRDIERVLYFESHVVIDPGLTDLEVGPTAHGRRVLCQARRAWRRIRRQDGRGSGAGTPFGPGSGCGDRAAAGRDSGDQFRDEDQEAVEAPEADGGVRQLGQPAAVDDHERPAGAASRPAPTGAARRRSLCDVRPERPLSSGHQSQQPIEAPA